MSKTFDCDRGFISKLLQTKDLLQAKDAQITLGFLSGDSKLAYKFIMDEALTTGEVPSVRVFKRKFPQYELEKVYSEERGKQVVGTEENLAYWIKELRAKRKHNVIADTIEEAIQDLDNYDGENAYKRIKKSIAYIESEVEETTDIDVTNTEGRKEAYLNRKKNKGMLGIPTGIEQLDFLMRGLAEKTLTTVIASTGIGKTWLEVLIGAYNMVNGNEVLQFVTEMSEEQMRDRYEAATYALLHGDFNYNHFKHGRLDRRTEKKYFKFLEDDLPNLPSLQIINATSPMGVSASIEKYPNAKLILIDGVYLMDDDQGADSDWLRVAHITRDIKRIAKRKSKPILANNQANNQTSKRTGPELTNISYSSAVGQDSDNVIGLFRDQTMIADGEMCVKLLKQREGELGRVMMNWDFDHMNFQSIYGEKEDGEQQYTEDDGEYEESAGSRNTIRGMRKNV